MTLDWAVDNVRRFEEVELKVAGATTAERAKALVQEMVAKGSRRRRTSDVIASSA